MGEKESDSLLVARWSLSAGDVVPRRRGKSKAPNFKYDGAVSVIRLELDVSDARVRRRLRRQWAAVFRLRRAVQRDAAARKLSVSATARNAVKSARSLRRIAE